MSYGAGGATEVESESGWRGVWARRVLFGEMGSAELYGVRLEGCLGMCVGVRRRAGWCGAWGSLERETRGAMGCVCGRTAACGVVWCLGLLGERDEGCHGVCVGVRRRAGWRGAWGSFER